jgi:hypothetical protein
MQVEHLVTSLQRLHYLRLSMPTLLGGDVDTSLYRFERLTLRVGIGPLSVDSASKPLPSHHSFQHAHLFSFLSFFSPRIL